MVLYKLLSVLLEYPDGELIENLDEIEAMIPSLQGASIQDGQVLRQFVTWSKGLTATEFQEIYVQTFDLTPDLSLHLTNHLFDEQDRDRGVTLVNLSQFFKQNGYQIENGELPDYLPLILEYVSTLDSDERARELLTQSAQALEVLANNLEKIDSPYAPLLRLVERHCEINQVAI